MVIQQSNDEGLRELALFAGAGGGILGGKLLGWRTICAVEHDAYAAQVLAQRQNDGILEPFPAKTFHVQEKEQDSMANAQGCGEKWFASLAKYNPDTHSLKIAQCSLLEDSTEYYPTLPKWGTMLNGVLYQQSNQGHSISAKEYGFLRKRERYPTPVTCGLRGGSKSEAYINGKLTLDGNLNPEFVENLMGWPIGWTDLRLLATDKFQKWLDDHGEF